MTRKRRKLTPFGKAVKKKAVDMEMPLNELADKLGISKQQLRNIMYGDRPGNDYRSQIVKILGLPEKWEVSV